MLFRSVGKPGLIDGVMVKSEAILIDFGYHVDSSGIRGDFDFKSCFNKASLITPTPGGTGPILVAKLFENFFRLNKFD